MSIDTEGSELEILECFSFDRHTPRTVAVEHNFTSAEEKLDELFADTTREHPFRRAGIAGADQVTLCFVVLRKDSTSDDTLQDELYELNSELSIAFNVVLLDQAALKQHYGDTLAPSLAQCEHMLDENVRLPTS